MEVKKMNFKLKDRVKMLQLYGMIGLFSRLFD